MARRNAAQRLAFGIVYLPLYALVLYPIAFILGVIVAAVDIAFTFVTNRPLSIKPRAATGLWNSISQGVTWVFSGKQSDKPGWIP